MVNPKSFMSKLAWNDINWALVQKRISRQQNRVYRASLDGNKQKVHSLQRRLLVSLDAKLIAVRRVTTESQRCNTPDVNRIKEISHIAKIELVNDLKIDGKTNLIRRTYIPKTDKVEYRTLGITTIEDRAKQTLVKLALEPEWEAIFEPNSYGFRPGRSSHDAIASLSLSLRGKTRYILEADIKQCFDRLDHEKLLKKLATFGIIEAQIRAWLKVDIIVSYLKRPDEVYRSIEGTPQKDIIVPLLVNIALHGLENHVKNWYSNIWYPLNTENDMPVEKKDQKKAIGFSRYADNFIITAPNLLEILEIEKLVNRWLKNEVGLELSKAKTRIVHSTSGFEFLGFQFISLNTGKNSKEETYKIKIHPSKESRTKLIAKIREIIQKNKASSSYSLIMQLSSRITGWANYFKFSDCSEDFSKIDYIIFSQIRAWVFRRKSKGLHSRTLLKEKYFPSGKTFIFHGKKYKNNWILTGKTQGKSEKEIKENFLPKLSWVNSSKYIKIKENSSPYNGDTYYWSLRAEKYSGLSKRISTLLKLQKGCCASCKTPFSPMDVIEVDQIMSKSQNCVDKFMTLQALHNYCHIKKTDDISVSNNDFDKII